MKADDKSFNDVPPCIDNVGNHKQTANTPREVSSEGNTMDGDRKIDAGGRSHAHAHAHAISQILPSTTQIVKMK